MRFRSEGGSTAAGPTAALKFDSESEFTEWIVGRAKRAGDRFPGEVETVGAIGPTVVLRTPLDNDTEVAVVFEEFKVKYGQLIAALRIPLGTGFSILQLEVDDPATGMVCQWNIGRKLDFHRVDNRPVSVSTEQAAQVPGEVDTAEAVVSFDLAYRALGRSRQFAISVVQPAKLKATRKLFAGFCPRCDGLLTRTGLRVEEEDNHTVLWEERCLDCDQRLLGWRRGDGRVPPGWRRMSPTEGTRSGHQPKPWWKMW